MSLVIKCPHCTLPTADSFEVLEEDTVHELTCAYCRRRFSMYFFECLNCAEDNVLTAVTPDALGEKVCSRCGSTHGESDSDGEATDF